MEQCPVYIFTCKCICGINKFQLFRKNLMDPLSGQDFFEKERNLLTG